MTEPTTKAVQTLAEKDPVWWVTDVESAPAIARSSGDDALDAAPATQAYHRLRLIAQTWHEVGPTDPVREAAVRFLRVHPLRAADALQLAAAFIAAERRPRHGPASEAVLAELVTVDDRLAATARKRASC